MAVYNLPNYTNDQGFGLPLNIRRGNPNPLDNSAVWASLDAAKNYAKTDPTAYVGQIISVVDNEKSIVDVYKINDTAGNLVLVGTVTLGDDQSIVKNDNDTLSLYDFGKKYYKFVAAAGDVAAHYEATEGWKDGLEPKVSGGVLAWYEPNPTTVDGLQSSINNLQAEVDTNKDNIKANTDAIAVLNGDKTTEGSVAYQIAAVVAGANADFDTLKEIADWIATHPDSVATINAAIKGNTDAIADLKELVGTDAVADQIAAAIEELNIAQYATAADLEDAKDDITANADAIEELQGLVGEGTVDERIDAAVKETVDGVKQDKFALREHDHVVADIDGLGATLDTLATKDTVNGIDGRVQAIENGLGTAIDAAIQTHNEAADAKYETIENVSLLSGQIDTKVAALEKADTDNLAAAKAHAETKIAELNITQYAKQADLDDTNAAIDAIKDHADVDSFADVMAKIAEKQDIIPENTYDAHGAAAAVDTKLEEYKTAANKRLDDLEAVDNATQDEMDAAVDTLEAADAAILAKIGSVAEGETVIGLIGAAKTAADNAKGAADAAQGDVDALEILVGAVPEGSDTVIAYVNKKAEEVLKAATGGSTESAASVKLALDNYIALNDPKVAANATVAAAAQSKADEAYGLAESKATMAEVNAAIEGAGHAVKDDVDSAIDGINTKIGEVPSDSNVMAEIAKAQTAATYNDEEVRGLISDNANDIKAISDDYLKAEDKTGLQNNIDGVSDRVSAIEGDYLKSADKTELQGKIDAKVAQTDYDTKMEEIGDDIDDLQTQINTIMSNPDAEGAINSINEFTQYIADHGTIADGFRVDIDQNKTDIAAEVKRAGEAETALSGRLDALEGIDHEAYVAADTALKNELNGVIAKKADTSALESAVGTLEAADTEIKGRLDTLEGKFTGEGSVEGQIAAAKQEAIDTAATDATNKANAAKTYADGLNSTMSARVDALELIDHDHANKAELDLIVSGDKAKWDDAANKAHEHTNAAELDKIAEGDVAKWNAAEQNAKDYSDGELDTAKSELEGKITAADTKAGNAQTALDEYKADNDSVVAGKADKSTTLAGYGITDAMTADEIIAMFTWSEF